MTTLTVRYQVELARTRAHAATIVGQAWDDLGSYRDGDVAGFVDAVVPIVQGAQQHAVTLTDAYLASRMDADPVGLGLDALQLRGVPLEEVYGRPFVTVWTALSKGSDLAAAVGAGRARAVGSAEMDVALATRDAASEWMAGDDRITGYERVPDGGACDFCLLASTQRYAKEDLMPLHTHCGCTVDPITADDRRGSILNRELLGDLQAKGVKVYDGGKVRTYGGTGPGTAMAVREHGELGPVITDAHDDFTSL